MASEVGGLDPLHGSLKLGNLIVQMRFLYMELANHTEKFIERKTTPVVPVHPAAQQPAPVVVEQPIMQTAPPQRKQPQPVQKKQEQQPAAVNEQHPYFE